MCDFVDVQPFPSAPLEHIELVVLSEFDNNSVALERLRQSEVEHRKQLNIEKKKTEKLNRELEIIREQLNRYNRGLNTESESLIGASADSLVRKLDEAERSHDQYVI